MTENEKVYMCKICLEKDVVNLLISPCHCKGSIKYVHPHCMAGWRKALLQTGRESDLYHCQLCKHRLWVKQRRLWATFLQYKVARAVVTALLLALILIPAGSMMKALIHFSVLLSNHPGGLLQAWKLSSLTQLLFTSSQASILASISPLPTSTLVNKSPAVSFIHLPFTLMQDHTQQTTSAAISNTFQVLYSPFPVCFLPVNSETSLFSNQWLYYILFPFSDSRLWQLILCRLQHFHLGFFLLGSINNIYFTYKILNDMFDIVLMGQDQADEEQEEAHDHPPPLEGIAKRLSKLLKGFLLTYCCSLVILFWIHFNIFAFHVDSKAGYSPKQFIAELPLWTLRWVTLGVAVVDFASRGIYGWLSKITCSVDQQDVLSLPEE